jgi:hypothetical protein
MRVAQGYAVYNIRIFRLLVKKRRRDNSRYMIKGGVDLLVSSAREPRTA